MTKIVLSASRDIPLNKLVLSQANVRRIKAGVTVEELAEDIARRGLLQSLSVRPVRDGQGQETRTFEVPAGGRRFQALQAGQDRPRALSREDGRYRRGGQPGREHDAGSPAPARSVPSLPGAPGRTRAGRRGDCGTVLRYPGCRAPAP